MCTTTNIGLAEVEEAIKQLLSPCQIKCPVNEDIQRNNVLISLLPDDLEAAKGFVQGPEVKEGLLNMVEMAFRAYDPCLGCATHSMISYVPLEINIRDKQKTLLKRISRL